MNPARQEYPGHGQQVTHNRPYAIATLAIFAWLPLMLHVIAGSRLGMARDWILLPAIPAAIVLFLIAWRALAHSTMARTGLCIAGFWIAMALLAPFLPLADPNKPLAPFAVPGSTHEGYLFLLGADMKGRDMLARVVWGCQRVIVWGGSATAIAYLFGTLAGLAAGYWRGWIDTILSFLGNVALSFPVMVLFILILNVLGPGGFNIIIAVTFASAPAVMRIVRGLTINLREEAYVKAAQMRGERALFILLVELLPNMRGPLLADLALRLGYTIVAITALTFLGLGLQPPDPDWGLMIAEAARVAVLWKFAYMLLIPALAVTSLVLGFNLIADGMTGGRAHANVAPEPAP